MFDSLYYPYKEEMQAFGEHWCGPDKYPSWDDIIVAKYRKHPGGDGQSVDVYCSAGPSRFYTLRVKAGKNSVNKQQEAYQIRTGSSCWNVAAELAELIADGMIGFYPEGATDAKQSQS